MYSTGNSAQCYVAVRMGEEFDGEWTHESVQFTHAAMSDSLQPDGLQHTRLPCPATTPRTCSNLCPSSWWCHPTISSSVVPFSSGLQSCPVSGSFLKSQFFASGGQSIRVSASASVLAMNFQDWFPLGWTSWISLQSKGLSAIFQYKKKYISQVQLALEAWDWLSRSIRSGLANSSNSWGPPWLWDA